MCWLLNLHSEECDFWKIEMIQDSLPNWYLLTKLLWNVISRATNAMNRYRPVEIWIVTVVWSERLLIRYEKLRYHKPRRQPSQNKIRIVWRHFQICVEHFKRHTKYPISVIPKKRNISLMVTEIHTHSDQPTNGGTPWSIKSREQSRNAYFNLRSRDWLLSLLTVADAGF